MCARILSLHVPLYAQQPVAILWYDGQQDDLVIGVRAFSVTGPVVWNSLPTDVRTASTLTNFKKHLNTYLFIRSHNASQNMCS